MYTLTAVLEHVKDCLHMNNGVTVRSLMKEINSLQRLLFTKTFFFLGDTSKYFALTNGLHFKAKKTPKLH